MKRLIFIGFISLLLLSILGCPPPEGAPSAYVVSGTDAVSDGVDGTYTLDAELFNSKPQYKSDPIGLVIFFSNSNLWLLYDSIEQMTIYQNTSQDEYPPESGWTKATGASVDVTLTPQYN